MQQATQSTLSDRSQAPNLQRGLAVLEYLAAGHGPATITQLAVALGLAASSVHRITGALLELEYLSRDPVTKSFTLTNKLLALGQPRANNRSLAEASIEAMRHVRRETGETTHLCCLVETEMVILDQLLSTHAFKYSADLGARCPSYSCAPGKVIAAWLPAGEQKQLIDRINFKKFTETTITSRRAFVAELAQIREQGYGTDRAEGMLGIHCIAAPILDRHEYPVASITIAAPASRLPEDQFETVAQHVITGAQMASTRFNH